MLKLVTTPPVSWLQTRFDLIPWAAITSAGGRSAASKREFLAAFATPARRRRVLTIFEGLLHEREFMAEVERGLLAGLGDKPALVMFGDRDPAREAGFEERWREILGQAVFRTLPGEMHFPHFAAAEAMSAHILDWSRGLAARAA